MNSGLPSQYFKTPLKKDSEVKEFLVGKPSWILARSHLCLSRINPILFAINIYACLIHPTKRLALLSEAICNFSLRLTIHFQIAVLETLQYLDNTRAVLLKLEIWKYVAKPRTLGRNGTLFLSKSPSRSTKHLTLNIKENETKRNIKNLHLKLPRLEGGSFCLAGSTSLTLL